MLFKLTRGVLVVLFLSCCGCQERQSNVASVPSKVNRQQKQDNPPASPVMVYYFHRTVRCVTCLSIEANVAQVIRDNFHQQIADGRLMWKPYNLDDPGGEKFEKEFDIASNTLVVAEMVNGSHVRYKKLEKVWQLLDNPEGFSEYVTDETNKFMNDK